MRIMVPKAQLIWDPWRQSRNCSILLRKMHPWLHFTQQNATIVQSTHACFYYIKCKAFLFFTMPSVKASRTQPNILQSKTYYHFFKEKLCCILEHFTSSTFCFAKCKQLFFASNCFLQAIVFCKQLFFASKKHVRQNGFWHQIAPSAKQFCT